MRFVKGISLFCLYPLLMLVVGVYLGAGISRHFQNETGILRRDSATSENLGSEDAGSRGDSSVLPHISEVISGHGDLGGSDEAAAEGNGAAGSRFLPNANQSLVEEASSGMQRLNVDTEYVLEETDLITQSVVETKWRLPDKYIGMTREQFIEALEVYEMAPPLAELERGFVGLQVLKFAPERVVVQMNYRYVEPSESFYLAVRDNEIVALLEDQETVYINTGIPLERVPEELQIEIMRMLWVEDEEALYGFLEAFSS